MNKKLLIAIPVVLGLAALWYYLSSTSEENGALKIKSLPILIDSYDPKTGMAGDMKFSNMELPFDVMYFDYGYKIPANSIGPEKTNPQPTFIAPLGTKVRAIVDGEIVKIEKIYSGDYSIMIAKNQNSNYYYEHEHVIKPTVKLGDKVKAGDVIAEVSDYDSRNTPGYGLVEIGILIGGNPPVHLCPFTNLDESVEAAILGKMEQLYKDWNAFKGKQVYDLSKYPVMGCLTIEQNIEK